MLSWQIPGGGLCALEPVITGTPPDPLVAFAELGRMKLGESDLQAVLGRVAELARQTLPGMVGASVTLVESDRAFTAAFSGQLALDLDETQYRDGFGPCLEVAQSAGTVTVPDMTAEARWPAFARQALTGGVHSSLSVALPLQEAVVGALQHCGGRRQHDVVASQHPQHIMHRTGVALCETRDQIRHANDSMFAQGCTRLARLSEAVADSRGR